MRSAKCQESNHIYAPVSSDADLETSNDLPSVQPITRPANLLQKAEYHVLLFPGAPLSIDPRTDVHPLKSFCLVNHSPKSPVERFKYLQKQMACTRSLSKELRYALSTRLCLLCWTQLHASTFIACSTPSCPACGLHR